MENHHCSWVNQLVAACRRHPFLDVSPAYPFAGCPAAVAAATAAAITVAQLWRSLSTATNLALPKHLEVNVNSRPTVD